jgi:hypothetical protein
MRFKTERLRVAVESAITQHEIEHNRANNSRRRQRADAEQQWVETYNAKWEQAIPRIRAAIRAGRPITVKEVATRNDHYRDTVALFADNNRSGDEPHVIPHDLMVMRNALRLVEDDEVTTTSLRTLGVSSTMLRTVCDLAREDIAKQQREMNAQTTAKPKPVKTKPRARKPITAAIAVTTVPQDRS